MFLSLATLLFLLCWFYLWKTSIRPKNFPPGPPYDPLLGNLRYILKRRAELGSIHLVMEELVEKYGKLVGLQVGMIKLVLVAKPNLVKQIYSKDEFNGRPSGFLWKTRSRGISRGIAFASGSLWNEQRKFCIQQLKQFGVGKNLMEEKIIAEANAFIQCVLDKNEIPINVVGCFTVFILNIIWSFVASKRFEPDNEEINKIIKTIAENFKLTDMSGGILNQIPFIRHIFPNKSGFTQLTKNYSIIYDFIEKSINEHRETQCEISRDLIDAYLKNISEGTDPFFDDEQLRVICLDFLQSGSETTSNSLSFLLLYMVQYPEIQKNVQNEIDRVIGNEQPNLTHKYKCGYTGMVILESMRKASVAPMGVARNVLKDVELNGYTIPKGTNVLIMMRYLNHDKIFENPDTFMPERFIDETNNLINHDKVETFGQGKRRCIGESMAKSTLFIFLTTILQKFDLISFPLGSVPSSDVVSGISLSPKPFKVIFKKRKAK